MKLFGDIFSDIFFRFFNKLIDYLPQLIGGFFIILIGLIVVKIVVKFIKLFLKFFRLPELLKKTKLLSEKETEIWIEVFLEVVRWVVFLIFLMPAFEIWGLSKAIIFLNQLINFLPNVIVSIIIAFFGIIFANLATKLLQSSFGRTQIKNLLIIIAKTIILFFTGLIILNQLGIAQDLIRILFAGIVGMLALAGGLAFGLGGKDAAKDLIELLKQRISQK